MSHHVFFMFAEGLAKPMRVPKGTRERMLAHVAEVERTLQLKTEKYLNNPPHWTSESTRFKGIDDKIVCRAVEDHNRMVRWFYRILSEASGKPKGKDTELLTPKQAAEFWHGLQILEVDPDRWTADYYRERMEEMYEVLRGRPTNGTAFDAKALNTKQANAVICLFSQYLDSHDIRLEVPWQRDHLVDSEEYRWCERCGAIAIDDVFESDDDNLKCPKCKKALD
jgi:hypothetical protein